VLAPAGARAQDAVATGVAQYRDAEFAAARRTLTRALEGDGLSRADAGRALGALAAVDFALGDVEAMRAHVAALAVVDPTYAFGPEIPPEIRDAFDEARTSARLAAVRLVPSGSGATRRLTAVLTGGRAGLRELVLECVDDLGVRASDRGAEPELAIARPARCEARAVWVGGAIVARASESVATDGAASPWTRAGARPRDEGPPWLWIGLGVGALVVVAVIVGVAVAASSGDPRYQLSGPAVTW